MRQEIIYSSIFWIFRIAAVVEIFLDMTGLMWFKNYYFSGMHIGETVISFFPLIALSVGAFATDSFFTNRLRFLLALGGFILGAASVAYAMYGDLTLINGPDYSAFMLRFIPLGLIVIFALRAFYCKATRI